MKSALNTINRFKLLRPGDKVVVAVSGGADSVALWHILQQLKSRFDLQLHLAHLNHLLRGKEAGEDAQFVQQLAQKQQTPATIQAQDAKAYAQKNKLSLQEAARRLRYQFLNQVAEKENATKIALGHNADDQAETVLLHLLRGSGITGLRAMLPLQGNLIRPLLETSRRQIMDFLTQNQLPFRTDSSNLQDKYLRNKIRQKLFPVLEQDYNPQIKQNLVQLADILSAEEDFWDQYLPPKLLEVLIYQDPRRVVLDCRVLRTMPTALQRRICRKALAQVQGNLRAINYAHIQQILKAAQDEKGEKHFSLPHQLRVIKSYDKIELTREISPAAVSLKEHSLTIPGITEVKEWNLRLEAKVLPAKEVKALATPAFYWRKDILPSEWKQERGSELTLDTAWLDWNKIAKPLYLRSRRAGDRFSPLGMKGSKKLKDFFIDNKVPHSQRDSIPLLVGGKEIIWVLGMRISDKVKVTADSKKVLWLQIVS